MATATHLRLRRIHGALGLLIGVFLVAHVANHLVALAGVDAHIALMTTLRSVYRHPLAETLLLAAVAGQVALGLAFLWRSCGKALRGVGLLQLVSGAYLAFFLIVHVSAVLVGRSMGLDTNFHFAAAGYQQTLTALFFVPYYFLAVVAVFTHLGCAAYWLTRDASLTAAYALLAGFAILGLIASIAISGSLWGIFIAFEVPTAYLETYRLFR